MVLVKSIYETTKKFPDEEKYGLVSQLRRASISISSNIAEGPSRNTAKDKSHFITISFSSLMELLNQLIIAKELGYVPEEIFLEIRKQIEKVANMLNALKKSQIKNP